MKKVAFKYGRLLNRMNKKERYMTRYELIKFAMRYGNKPASREYKTTAKTVRKWVKRYQEKGLSGLYDKSRRPKTSPNKCSKRVEKEIVALRKKTKHRYGAKRLIERFDLPVGKSCVQRIIKDHNLTRKPKTKKQKRNCLWSIKKLMSVFEERGITHLDLHGTKHQDVESIVINFVYQFQDLLPLIIICGNSNKMIEIASAILYKADIGFSSPRFGILRIEKV